MITRRFEQTLARLVAAYPQREVSAASIALYTERFATMDARLFAAAVEECIDTHDWLPSVHQVQQAAIRVLARARILPPSAEDAWATVLEIARTWHEGAMIGDRLPEQARAALSAAGGIRAVAQASGEWELGRIESRFSAAYTQYRSALEVAALRGQYGAEHGLSLAGQRSGAPQAIGERGSRATR